MIIRRAFTTVLGMNARSFNHWLACSWRNGNATVQSIAQGWCSIVSIRRFLQAVVISVVFLGLYQPVMAQAQSKQIDQTTYEDFVKQCVGPTVVKAVDAHYGKPTRIAYTDMKILDIKRIQSGSYWFETTVSVKTFYPPYAVETITLSNMTKPSEGHYKVIRYVHKKL